jgi:hypothetical protein
MACILDGCDDAVIDKQLDRADCRVAVETGSSFASRLSNHDIHSSYPLATYPPPFF